MIGDWDDDVDFRNFHTWAHEMASGDFATAWKINDREKKHWPSAHRHWDGKPLNGRWVSVASLHGLGDAIQMLQYARALRTITERLAFRVPTALLSLAPHFEFVNQFVDLDDSSYTKEPWVSLELMELPYVFRTSPDELPLVERYLDPSGWLKLRYRNVVRSGLDTLRIGLASHGGSWDRERWLSLAAVQTLIDGCEAEFTFLQGLPADAPPAFEETADVLHGDLTELVGTIANLDLVVSVDTLSAHIAGALGVPCYLLLKKDSDWRWQQIPSHTSWYPSMKLFRQVDRGDWSAPIAAVIRELRGRRYLRAGLGFGDVT